MQDTNSTKDIGETFPPMVCNNVFCQYLRLKLTFYVNIARSFIRKCLSLSPDARPTATEALNDVWMTGQQAKDIDLLDTVRENFNARRTFKSAISAVKAMNRIRAHSISRAAAEAEAAAATENDEKKRAATTLVAPTAQALNSMDIGTDVARVKTVQ